MEHLRITLNFYGPNGEAADEGPPHNTIEQNGLHILGEGDSKLKGYSTAHL